MDSYYEYGLRGVAMKLIMKINRVLERIGVVIIIALTAGMALLLMANVFCRYVLKDSLSFAEELGILLFIAVTYLSCPYATRYCKHIRMNAFIEKMTKIKKPYCMIIDLITGIAFLYLGIMMFQYTMNVFALGAATPALHIPRWVCVSPVLIGLVCTGLQFVLSFVLNLTDKENFWIGSNLRECDKGKEGGLIA